MITPVDDADAFAAWLDDIADAALDYRPGDLVWLHQNIPDALKDLLTSRVRDACWQVAKEAARLHTVVKEIQR